MIQFYIIYSIDKEVYNLYEDMDFYELIEYCKNKKIDSSEIEDCGREGIEEYLLSDKHDYEDMLPNFFKNDINTFILDNDELFTNKDYYIEDEYVTFKCSGLLSIKQFVDFLDNTDASSTCDTLGSISEYGHLPAFSVQGDYDNIYVSTLYKKEYTEDQMEEFEDSIRNLIEDYNLTEENITNNIKDILNGSENNK